MLLGLVKRPAELELRLVTYTAGADAAPVVSRQFLPVTSYTNGTDWVRYSTTLALASTLVLPSTSALVLP